MGHVPVSGRFERVAMDLLDVSVISAKGYKYILVVCDLFHQIHGGVPTQRQDCALCGGRFDGHLATSIRISIVPAF